MNIFTEAFYIGFIIIIIIIIVIISGSNSGTSPREGVLPWNYIGICHCESI